MHYSLSYSLEPNPDERLNHSLKGTLSHLSAAKYESNVQKQIIGRLRSWQNRPERICSLFDSSSTLYAS